MTEAVKNADKLVVGERNLYLVLIGVQVVQPLYRSVQCCLKKLKTVTLNDPAFITPGHIPNGRDTCTSMFIAALPATQMSKNKGMDNENMVYLQTETLFSCSEKSDSETYRKIDRSGNYYSKQGNLDSDKYCMFSLRYGS